MRACICWKGSIVVVVDVYMVQLLKHIVKKTVPYKLMYKMSLKSCNLYSVICISSYYKRAWSA